MNEFKAFDEQALARLSSYVELLQKWTKKVDLVSPATDQKQVDRHIVDSVAAYWMIKKKFSIHSINSCIDVGSGAGLPGLVFAICEPSARIYLCEPRERRVMFLNTVIKSLALENVKTLHMRSSEISIENLNGERVDFITARAVGDDSALTELSKIALSDNGKISQLVGPSYESAKDNEPSEVLKYSLPACGEASAQSRALALWLGAYLS